MLKKKIQVVLLERVEKLGQMGQVIAVAPGYARNFLLPKKKALRATKGNLAYFEEQKAVLEANNLQKKQDAQYVANTLDGAKAIIIRQASEMGHLYGSVRNKDISESLEKEGFKVDKNLIHIEVPIKTIGEHKIRIKLHSEVDAFINVIVARSEEEARNKNKDDQAESEETVAN